MDDGEGPLPWNVPGGKGNGLGCVGTIILLTIIFGIVILIASLVTGTKLL